MEPLRGRCLSFLPPSIASILQVFRFTLCILLLLGSDTWRILVDSICCDVFEIMTRHSSNLKGTVVLFPNLKALEDICFRPKAEEDTCFVDIICQELKPSYFMELSSSSLYSCTPYIRVARKKYYRTLSKLNLLIINPNSLFEENLCYRTISENLESCISFSLEIGSKCSKNGIDVRSKFASTMTCLTAINFEMNAKQTPTIVKTPLTLSYTYPDFLTPNLRLPLKSLCSIYNSKDPAFFDLEAAFVSNEKFSSIDFLESSTLIPLILEGILFFLTLLVFGFSHCICIFSLYLYFLVVFVFNTSRIYDLQFTHFSNSFFFSILV